MSTQTQINIEDISSAARLKVEPSWNRWRKVRRLICFTCFVAAYLHIPVILELHNAREIYIVAEGGGPGRLGNKMFQYASALGVSRQRKTSSNDTVHFCVDPRHPFNSLSQIFDGPFPKCSFPDNNEPPRIGRRWEAGFGKYQVFDTTCDWKGPCYLTLGLYMQSFRYLESAEAEIRETYRFQSHILKSAEAILSRVRLQSSDNITLVAIHVRRGDVRAVDFFQMAPASYFEQAMAYFRQEFQRNVRFLVASDETEWCREQDVFRQNDTTILPKRNAIGIDLAVLSSCHHAIMSVGSFGWWAAWLTGGKVIYYKDGFVLNARTIRGQLCLEDYYPPSWIAMS